MEEVNKIVGQLTLEEKASLTAGKNFWELVGVERLGLPSIMVTDGPHGLRKQSGSSDHLGLANSVQTTCFPTAVGLASSWDIEVAEKIGIALAEECLQEKVSVILGPGANIKRNPLCGRNFEYFSEDPYLSGKMASHQIKGTQSLGVGTSLKHFAANNQEENRMTIDTLVDERTLREIYLTSFEIPVKESQPWTVMNAYNKLNGVYCAENKMLLDRVLKGEWGHEGIVVTDWGANNDCVEGLISGQELTMPGDYGYTERTIVEAVRSGKLDEQVLDLRVKRIVEMILKAKETLENHIDFEFNKEAHHRLARELSAETMVLLKNNGILPLKVQKNILVLGEFAEKPRYQGSGSSRVNPTRLDTFNTILQAEGYHFTYAKGYSVTTDEIDDELVKEATDLAKDAEVVIILAGLTDSYESEGFDRKHINLPENHKHLIEEVAKINPKTIVCLSNGSPVAMPWLSSVAGLVETYLSGQAGAGALFDILTGRVTPSAKLAETFPHAIEDSASYRYFANDKKQLKYKEGIYVGYRFYDKAEVDVLFPFGFGLSYTTFEYSNLKISDKQIKDTEELAVTFDITNTGTVYGKEVCQVYIKDRVSTIHRPIKELRAFEKVSLKPGETKTVTVKLDKRAFAYYNCDVEDFVVETGAFDIMIGCSSVDIRLTESVVVESTVQVDESNNDQRERLPFMYHISKDFSVSDEVFELMYGKKILEVDQNAPYTPNTRLADIQDTSVGRQIIGDFQKQMMTGEDTAFSAEQEMLRKMVEEMPIRGLAMLSGGKITREATDLIVQELNKERDEAIC